MASDHVNIDIGLIGLGSWAKSAFVPALQEHAGVNIRAVAARTQATRDAARDLFGPDIRLYDDYSELVEHDPVEAVMIGLPRSNTVDSAAAAVRAGKHVFVEPPLGYGLDSGLLLEQAVQGGKVFHVDLELRYLPIVAALEEIVIGGGLGRLLQVRVELENDWGRRRVAEAEAQDSIGVGLGTWYIDLLDLFAEQVPHRLDVFAGYPTRSDQMEIGTVSIEYPGGLLGEWAFNLRSGKDLELRLKIVGAEGEASADLMSGSYRYRTRQTGWKSGTADCSRPIRGFVGMKESVSAFLGAVTGEGETRSGPAMYSRLHATLGALRRSEAGKASVRLDED